MHMCKEESGIVPYTVALCWSLSRSPVAVQGAVHCTDLSFLINGRVMENYSVGLYMIEHVAGAL